MKDTAALSQFLRDEVNLNQSRYDNAKDRLRTLENHLKENLDGFQGTEIQGSYATETIIRPVDDNDEYDIDLMVYIKDDGSEPKEVVDGVVDCLSENSFYKEHSRVGKRGVPITYANQFKIDVVPCVERDGRKWVCNRAENKWEITDGSGYKDWFRDQNRKSNGHLKKVVRLLKYLRDHKNTFTVRSIALTTLAGLAVEEIDPSRLNTLPNALEAVTQWIDDYLQRNSSPDLQNPALAEEDFNRHWTDAQYQNFRKMFHTYTSRIKEAIECDDPEKSEKLWQGMFGPKYRRSNPGNSSHGGGQRTRPQMDVHPSSGGATRRGKQAAIATLGAPSTFRPPSPYAVAQGRTRKATAEHDLTPLTRASLEWIRGSQPGLAYREREGLLLGTVHVRAAWDPFTRRFTANTPSSHSYHGNLIDDEFNVSIELRYRTRWLDSHPRIPNRYPRVSEIGGRTAHLQRKLGVPLADLHMFPDGECCLGFNILAPNGRDFIGRDFIERDVTPWLYRLAFVERFGLSHAESQLWATYQHTSGPVDYIAGVRQIALAQPQDHDQCPCGTEEHYVRCHKDEVEQCERDGLVTFGAK